MPNANPQILSVDDDQSIRALIKAKLEKKGYQCHTVSSGEAAIEVLKTVDVDLALLDVIMPVMTGLSLFQVIKELTPEVGVIFVTSIDDMDLAFNCIKNGALDYVIKSKIPYRLLPSVEQALERRAAMLDKDRRLEELENLLEVQAEVIDHKSREILALNQLIHGSLKSLLTEKSLVTVKSFTIGELPDATGAGQSPVTPDSSAQSQEQAS